MLLVKSKRVRWFFGAVETLSLLSLKLWLKNPARARSFCGRVFRDYMSLVGEDRWLSRELKDILPPMNDWSVVLDTTPDQGIFTPVDELAYLALITKSLQPRNIFEIGTFHGRTALNFALNSPPDCLVHTLDLPPTDGEADLKHVFPYDAALILGRDPGRYYQGKESSRKIRQLLGDSRYFDFSPYHGRMDLVFIDGSHNYDTVRSDTLNALKMVTETGFIVWHDFANYGDYNEVTQAILDLMPAREVVQIANTQLAVYRKTNQLLTRRTDAEPLAKTEESSAPESARG